MTQPSTTVAGPPAMTAINGEGVDQLATVVAGPADARCPTNYGRLVRRDIRRDHERGRAGGIQRASRKAWRDVRADGERHRGRVGQFTPITVTSATASTITFVTQPAGTRRATFSVPWCEGGRPVWQRGRGHYRHAANLRNSVNGSTVLMTNSAGEARYLAAWL